MYIQTEWTSIVKYRFILDVAPLKMKPEKM